MPAIYNAAYVTRQVISSWRKDPAYNPTRETLYRLILTLHLSLRETNDLLASAGYALRPNELTDITLRACIEHKLFNPIQIDSILISLGKDPLFSIK